MKNDLWPEIDRDIFRLDPIHRRTAHAFAVTFISGIVGGTQLGSTSIDYFVWATVSWIGLFVAVIIIHPGSDEIAADWWRRELPDCDCGDGG